MWVRVNRTTQQGNIMSNEKSNPNKTVNKNRRRLLQGAALVGTAGFAPTRLKLSCFTITLMKP